MTERKQWGVGGGEPESNNLVYTKRLKDMYANRKHETTPHKTITGRIKPVARHSLLLNFTFLANFTAFFNLKRVTEFT